MKLRIGFVTNSSSSSFAIARSDLTDEQIETLAYKCSFMETRYIGGFKKLEKADMIRIYQMAR